MKAQFYAAGPRNIKWCFIMEHTLALSWTRVVHQSELN